MGEWTEERDVKFERALTNAANNGELPWSWVGAMRDLRAAYLAHRAELAAARATIADREQTIARRVEQADAYVIERDEALREVERYRKDLRLAAGELRVPVPEPGTDMARLLAANVLMRRERDEAHAEVTAAWEALGGDLTGDLPEAIRQLHGHLAAANVRAASLDADLRKMAHAWRTAEARVAELEAVLAEPSEEEAERIGKLAFDEGIKSTPRPFHRVGRAILADLRQRAGVTP